MDLENILLYLSGAGTVVAIVAAIVAMGRNRKKDASDDGRLYERIDHISASVDEIKRNQHEAAAQAATILERLAACESSTKSAHKRIDNLEQRINQ